MVGCLGRIAPFPSGNAKNTGFRIEFSAHSRAVSLSFRSDSALARAWGPVSRAPEPQVPQIAAKLPSRFSRDPCFGVVRRGKCRKWRQSYLLLGCPCPGSPCGPLRRSGGQGGESGINYFGDLARLGLQNDFQVADIAPLGSELSSRWLGRSPSEAGKSRLATLRPFCKTKRANSLRELARSPALGLPATRSIRGWGRGEG